MRETGGADRGWEGLAGRGWGARIGGGGLKVRKGKAGPAGKGGGDEAGLAGGGGVGRIERRRQSQWGLRRGGTLGKEIISSILVIKS